MISTLWLLLLLPAFLGGMLLMACLSVGDFSASDVKKSEKTEVFDLQNEKEVKP